MERQTAQAAYLIPMPVAFGIDTPGLSIPLLVLLGKPGVKFQAIAIA